MDSEVAGAQPIRELEHAEHPRGRAEESENEQEAEGGVIMLRGRRSRIEKALVLHVSDEHSHQIEQNEECDLRLRFGTSSDLSGRHGSPSYVFFFRQKTAYEIS